MICEICGKDKPDVERRPDPFLAEVHDEVDEHDYCDQCFEVRAADV